MLRGEVRPVEIGWIVIDGGEGDDTVIAIDRDKLTSQIVVTGVPATTA